MEREKSLQKNYKLLTVEKFLYFVDDTIENSDIREGILILIIYLRYLKILSCKREFECN